MKICTHNGRFHCDEVLACTLLTRYTTQFHNATILRSRDPKVWEQCDIIVDVGGQYNPPRWLDHHQIEFQHTYPNHNIRMSSAGLVYLHFKEIIPNIIQNILQQEQNRLTFTPIINEQIIDELREKIYKNFIIYIDANDNGVDKIYEKDVSGVPTTLWCRVSKTNPMWWDDSANEEQLFRKAMDMVDEELSSEVKHALLYNEEYFRGSIQTYEMVRQAFEKRKEIDEKGRIVLLERYVPWQKSITRLEEGEKCEGEVLFVVFPDKDGMKWRIQAVAMREGSFELRKGLKSEWRGIKDMNKLVTLSGIEDIDFVHAAGFIGGAVSRESAIKMGMMSCE